MLLYIYVNTEDGFENLYEFQDDYLRSNEIIIHYQAELQKVCKGLNLITSETLLQQYEVIDMGHHPTIVFHMEHILSSDMIFTKSTATTTSLL